MILKHELWTRAGERLLDDLKVNPETPVLPEYPRPQLERSADTWLNLNGYWDYAILDRAETDYDPVNNVTVRSQFLGEITPYQAFLAQGLILVPFAPESKLSGVEKLLLPDQVLWYRRRVTLPQRALGKRIFLHAGAIDQLCSIWINGRFLASHRDGYLPFSFELTGHLDFGDDPSSFEISIAVMDPSDQGLLPYGKQKLKRGGMWYTPSSGIWQTIWLEFLPADFIQDFKVTPLPEEAQFAFEFRLSAAAAENLSATVRLFFDGRMQATADLETKTEGVFRTNIQPSRCIWWTPETPHLYTWIVELKDEEGRLLDRVRGYCGMRSFGIGRFADGAPCLLLNGEPYKHLGVLDQGYFADGLYSAASDQLYVDDILAMKAQGFNVLRKHIKIEPQRFYYHCDRLGILVWQDLVNGGRPYNPWVIAISPFIGIRLRDSNYRRFGRGERESIDDMAARQAAITIHRETCAALKNTVSLCLWVIFNEGWGQFDAVQLAEQMKRLDPERLVDHASGWHDQGGPDLNSLHVYFRKFRAKRDRCLRPLALTEFGGYSLNVPGHSAARSVYGYKKFTERKAYLEALERLYRKEILPVQELAASIYTQLSDVEDETNGILTYDRKVNKWEDADRLRELLREVRKN